MPNELLDAALELAKLGWHVIPVEPAGKKPLVEWKVYQREPASDIDIRVWWERWPDANVGLVLGRGTCAVDIDGEEGFDSLRQSGCIFPDSATRVKTGRGEHVYLRADVPDKVRALPGVDIRGVGFVVAPPSKHESGVRYSFITPVTSPDRLPELPSALLNVLTKDKHEQGLYAPEQDDWVARLMAEGSPEGSRNSDGARLAGYLFRTLPADIAKACLLAWSERCTPPLPRAELDVIADSISRRAIVERALPRISYETVKTETEAKSQSECVGDILQDVAQHIHVPTKFVSSPWQSLNDLLYGGITCEEYLILGGRPGVGKTAAVVQFAKHVSESGGRVLFVTLEMSPRQLAARLAVLWSGIPAGEIRRGGLTGDELLRFKQACIEMRQLPIVIEAGLQSAEQMYALVEQASAPFDLMILDYIQCLKPMVPSKTSDRRKEIDEASAALKAIPRRLKVPMIAISSLARREGEPTIHELKESGSLEYDADIVLLMHREKFSTMVKATVGKARDAQVGSFALYQENAFSFTETPPGHTPGTIIKFEEPF